MFPNASAQQRLSGSRVYSQRPSSTVGAWHLSAGPGHPQANEWTPRAAHGAPRKAAARAGSGCTGTRRAALRGAPAGEAEAQPVHARGRLPDKAALGSSPSPHTRSTRAPRTLVSTSARQSLRNWSKSPWLLRWFTIMATSCGSPAPAPAPPAPPAPEPAPGPGGGGGGCGCGCGGGGGGAGGGGCGCGLVAMAAWAGEGAGAGPGGRASGRSWEAAAAAILPCRLREANGMLLRNQPTQSNPGSEREPGEGRRRP